MDGAAKLADWRIQTVKRVSEITGRTAQILDAIVLMETYYGWLTHLWKHNQLPDDSRIER
jgi:hypothetical protein